MKIIPTVPALTFTAVIYSGETESGISEEQVLKAYLSHAKYNMF